MKKSVIMVRLALLLLCAFLLIACVYEVKHVPDHLQYAVLPPAGDIAPEKLLSSLNALSSEWESSVSQWQLSAVFEDLDVTSESGQRTLATAHCITKTDSSFMPVQLISGRAFTDEEMKSSENVAYIDQDLSHALFKTTDAQGLNIFISGQMYSVVGIVDNKNAPGEKNSCHIYLPYLSIERLALSPDALVVAAAPIPGAGANAAFSYVARAWMPGGTEISLKREKMAATLWPRTLVFAVGIAAFSTFIRLLSAGAKAIWAEYQNRLKDHYAIRLLPIFIPACLFLLTGFIGSLYLLYQLLTFMIRPVYTFTEYVPESLVKWTEIKETFRAAIENASGALFVRTQEYLHLRFLAGAIRVLTAVIGLILVSFKMRLPLVRRSADASVYNDKP